MKFYKYKKVIKLAYEIINRLDFPNACITYRILLKILKFFKIKIDKILLKIDYVTRKIK
jgi:hypothetical protein